MSAASGSVTASQARSSDELRRLGRLSVGSWVLYDLANTSFSLGIVTAWYPLLLTGILGYDDATVGTLDSLAAGCIFVAAPVLGALSDQARRRLPFLAISTLLCVLFTFLLGQGSLLPGFALFVAANVCFQAGLIFYDSLLPEVTTEANRARVGGVGVGVGYCGSLLAIGAGWLVLGNVSGSGAAEEDYATIFRLIAVIFLVFALPAFVFIRERARVVPALSPRIVPDAFRQLGATARHARRYPGLAPFLLGRMFYADAANTLIAMVAIYATGSFGLTSQEAALVAIPSILAAIPAGFAWGVVADRIGPKRTLDIVLVLWMIVFGSAAAIPVLGMPAELIWVVATFVGIGLAGLWAADRPLMARIAPPRYYGQFFGLYAMVGRFAAVVGPFMWGVIASGLGWGQPAAVLFLLLWVAIAFGILRFVDDRPRDWAPEDLPILEGQVASGSSEGSSTS
jgi:UMF1 family MFS transporter